MFVVFRYIKALKDNRSLIWTFAVGELKNKYRNSVLGFLWSIIEPLLMMSVLYFVFNTILKPDIPNFAIYLLLGLIVWRFMTRSTTMGIDSLTSKGPIISHVYFMRAIPAISSNISALIMLGFEFIILSIFIIVFGVVITPTVLLVPYIIFIIFLITLGLSLALSVISIRYKDVRFIWDVILTAGFFIHPIIYTKNMLSGIIKEILDYLPTVKLFHILHDSVLFDSLPNLQDFTYVTLAAFATLVVGYLLYKKFEPDIAEVL